MSRDSRVAVCRLDRVRLVSTCTIVLILAASLAFAASVVGDWNGTLKVPSVSLRIVLHMSADSSGKLTVTMDDIDQNAMGIPVSDAQLKGSNFTYAIPSIHGSFSGTVSQDGKTLDGTWSQNGHEVPLKLSRGNGAQAVSKPADMAGDWNGAIGIEGAALRLVLHVTGSAGSLRVTLDSPDQHANGLQGSNAVLDGKSFSFQIPAVHGTYTGTLAGDGKTIDGTWSQSGATLPLAFSRGG